MASSFIFEIRNYLGCQYTIDFMPSDGGDIRKMPNHPKTKEGECHPAFSPDGKWMCWNAGDSLAHPQVRPVAAGRDRRQDRHVAQGEARAGPLRPLVALRAVHRLCEDSARGQLEGAQPDLHRPRGRRRDDHAQPAGLGSAIIGITTGCRRQMRRQRSRREGRHRGRRDEAAWALCRAARLARKWCGHPAASVAGVPPAACASRAIA